MTAGTAARTLTFRLAWLLLDLAMRAGEHREARRPCTVCGDTPTDPAAQLCGPCLAWDGGWRN